VSASVCGFSVRGDVVSDFKLFVCDYCRWAAMVPTPEWFRHAAAHIGCSGEDDQ
jgi:hypothetical protein